MRVGVAGFQHETNTFITRKTSLQDFIDADAWPGLLRGPAIAPGVAGMNIPIAGMLEAARAEPWKVVPLLWCSANPSGPVEAAAYEQIWRWTEDAIDTALRGGPLDALLLDLHGAMVAEHVDDGEGEWLARLRLKLGATIPIVTTLDFHANISAEMVQHADALLVYRTYPHVDMAETGRDAIRMLKLVHAARQAGTRLHAAWHRLGNLVPLPLQTTLAEPMRGIMDEARALATGDVAGAYVVPGFPAADVAFAGFSVLTYGTTPTAAKAATDLLVTRCAAAQSAFVAAFPGAVTAAADAVHARDRVILADTEDNPGGGAPGTDTALLRALLGAGAAETLVGVMCDAPAAAAAQAAGVGGHLDAVGEGPQRVTGPFEVMGLGNGRFEGAGPFYAGCRFELGLMAALRKSGVTLVVSSRKQQAADREMFRHVGMHPEQFRILALKSSAHFRADFTALADRIVVVAAGGTNTADMTKLVFRKYRPGNLN